MGVGLGGVGPAGRCSGLVFLPPPSLSAPCLPAPCPLQLCYCCFEGGRLQALHPFPTWLRRKYKPVSQLSGSQQQVNISFTHMHEGCLWGGGYLGGSRGGVGAGMCCRFRPAPPSPAPSLTHAT